jgi:hypothetical protein
MLSAPTQRGKKPLKPMELGVPAPWLCPWTPQRAGAASWSERFETPISDSPPEGGLPWA